MIARFVVLFVAVSMAPAADLVVNKYVCEFPAANTPIPDPASVDAACTDVSSVNAGTLVTYYVTVANRDTSGNNTANLTDNLPPGFVITGAATCQAFGSGANCGSGPGASGNTVSFSSMNIPSTGTVTIRIDGYFTQTGKPVNKAVAGPHTGAAGSNEASKEVDVPAYALLSDLSVGKSVTAVSGNSNRFHYTITVKNTGQTVYPEGLLRLDDMLTFNLTPVSFQILNYKCTPSAAPAGVCPGALAQLAGNVTSSQHYLHQYWTVPEGTTAGSDPFESRGEVKIEFDMEFNPLCGSGELSISNTASFAITATGGSLPDSKSSNNKSDAGPVKITFEKDSCAAMSKIRLPGKTDWGTPQKYTITLTNYASQPAQMKVTDHYLRTAGTPPFEITAITTPTCSPNTCTAPVVTATPISVLNEHQSYLLFTLIATVPAASGLAPGTLVISFDLTLRPLADCQADPRSGRIWNTASFDWLLTKRDFVTLGNSSADFEPPALPPCRLEVTKVIRSENSALLEFNQLAKFQITYRNSSNSTLVIHTLADVMGIDSYPWGPLPITVQSSSSCTATGVSPAPNVLSGSFTVNHANPVTSGGQYLTGGPFTFQAGGTVTCDIEFKASPPPDNDAFCSAAPAKLFNTAIMDPGGVALWVNPLKAKNAQVSIPLPKCRKVLIQKTVERPQYAPGETVVFTIRVTNTGNDPLSGVVVTDPLPPGFVVTSVVCSACTGQPTSAGNVVNAALSTVTPGSTTTITISATAPSTGGSYSNVASLQLPDAPDTFFEGGGRSNEANVQILTPRLSKEFSAETANFGDTVTLTFRIQNVQGKAESGIGFTDTLPPGLVYTGIANNTCKGQPSIGNSGASFTLSDGALDARQDCMIVLNVRVVSCGVLENRWSSEPGRSNITNTNNIDPSGAADTLRAEKCPPSLTVQKSLAGAPSGYAGTFKFDVVCVTSGGTVQKELTITWPATTASLTGLPAGSTCTVRERDLPPPPAGFSWHGVPSYSPGQTVVIGGNGEGNVVGVRNVLKPCDDRGEVKITKKLENVPPGFRGTFRFNVFCVFGNSTFSQTAQITLPGPATVSVVGMPAGSLCTVTETGPLPALPAGWFWTSPTYSPQNGSLNLAPVCCQEVVVTNRAKFCCVVNPYGGGDSAPSGYGGSGVKGLAPPGRKQGLR